MFGFSSATEWWTLQLRNRELPVAPQRAARRSSGCTKTCPQAPTRSGSSSTKWLISQLCHSDRCPQYRLRRTSWSHTGAVLGHCYWHARCCASQDRELWVSQLVNAHMLMSNSLAGHLDVDTKVVPSASATRLRHIPRTPWTRSSSASHSWSRITFAFDVTRWTWMRMIQGCQQGSVTGCQWQNTKCKGAWLAGQHARHRCSWQHKSLCWRRTRQLTPSPWRSSTGDLTT